MTTARRCFLLCVLVACGSKECRSDPSPSCSYRPERGVIDPDAPVPGFADEVREVRAGDTHACALLSTGDDFFGGEATRPRCWGGNANTQLSRANSPDLGELWWYSRWELVGFFEVGAAHSCIIDPSDPGGGDDDRDAGRAERRGPEIECWGSNAGGQLGVAPDDPIDGLVTAARPDPDLDLTGLALGGLHSCFADSFGVECWGDNRWGQLGVPDADCCRPVLIRYDVWGDAPREQVSLTAGTRHTCALLRYYADSPGPLFCWGDNTHGQLGNIDAATVPMEVHDSDGASLVALSVAAGPHHTCAIVMGDDGREAHCWGRNGSGELGIGDETDRSEPTRVNLGVEPMAVFAGGESGLTFDGDLDDVRPGAAHSCALDEKGAAYCWGDNSAGQLGVAASDPALSPVATHPELRFRTLALGGRFTCGITRGISGVRSDDELLCWGDNSLGQLGRAGLGSDQPSPVAIFSESSAE